MILDDLKCQNRGFYKFFGNFGLRHTFQKQIVPKSLQIDLYNPRMKFSTLNVDLTSLSFDPIGSKRPTHKVNKDGYPLKKSLFYFYQLHETSYAF